MSVIEVKSFNTSWVYTHNVIPEEENIQQLNKCVQS